ncbi:hypothetical protein R9X47_21480 [Wukongibacter baidiensis]|uniref:hypothetical protein n=1 Tax=Wukongibacter baidiensis TaxID=1723361 RepID=UPI003D7F2F9A
MRVSFLPQRQISSFSISYGLNDNSGKKSSGDNKESQSNRTAKATNVFGNNRGIYFGKKVKKNSIIENLMKQKEKLIDSRSSFLEKALESGKGISAIKEKLDGIDDQIKEIEKQISKIQLEEQRKSLNTEKKNKKNGKSNGTSDETSSKDMKSDESMNRLLSLSGNLSRIQTLSSQNTSMAGETRVLESEIKIDKGRGIDPVDKKERVAELKDNIENISEKIGEELQDINTKAKSNMESSSLNKVLDKRQEENEVSGNKSTENKDVLVKEGLAQKCIKHYRDSINYKSKYSGEKINIVA